MPKELLNEAERFLIQRWTEAQLLEESMDGIRTKYKELFERIIDAVKEAHPEFDACVAYPTQFWGQGHLGFGRRSWPGGETHWPSGLWVDGLRLELLAAEDSEPPYSAIWVSKKAKNNFDYDAARLAVKKASKDLLSPDELNRAVIPESEDEVLLYLPAPSKDELLGALSKGDGQGFVALFIPVLDLMGRFVPVLDKVFRECLGKGKD